MTVEIVGALIGAVATITAAVISRGQRAVGPRPSVWRGRALVAVAGTGIGLMLVSVGVLITDPPDASGGGPTASVAGTAAPAAPAATRTRPTAMRTSSPTPTVSPPVSPTVSRTSPPAPITVVAQRKSRVVTCAQSYTFSGRITVTQVPATVSYQWFRGGDGLAERGLHKGSVRFTQLGEAQPTTDLHESFGDAKGELWAELRVYDPVRIRSNRVTVNRRCPAAPSGNAKL